MKSWLMVAVLALAGGSWSLAQDAPAPTGAAFGKPESSCILCHKQLDGAALEPTKHLDDIHLARGLSCHDCHGGDPTRGGDEDPSAAHDEKKGWKEKPTRLQIPAFCGRCHADAVFMKNFNPQIRVDQLTEYRTSVHGQRNAKGDERTAVCIDCHGVHGIRAIKDPRSTVHPTRVADTCARCHSDGELMVRYGAETGQVAAYKTSVHAQAIYERGDLSAPTCNDCHGSHGAGPPGVSTVAQVCGSCHSREGSLYRETEQKNPGLNLTPAIQCVTCHDNHAVHRPTDAMIGTGPESVCTGCHGPETPQFRSAEVMGRAIQQLSSGLAEAGARLNDAERAGVEISADRFALRAGENHLVEARVLVHSFDEERLLAAVHEGMASVEVAAAAGDRAFAELRQRRTGLAVSLIVITAVIAGLVLKLKEIERNTTF